MNPEPEQDEQEQPEQETPETEPSEPTQAKRFRRKSVRRQLQEVVTKLGKIADDNTQKSAKRADAVLKQADLLLRLQTADADEAETRLQGENDLLTAQHEQDAATLATQSATIAQLNAELAHIKANPTIVERVKDPDASLRGQLDAAKEVIAHLAKRVSSSPAAVAAYGLRRLGSDAAKLLCEHAGIDYKTWMGFRAYSSPVEWKGVLNRAVNGHDTDLCRFCLANLEANGERWEPPVETVPAPEPQFDVYATMVAQRMGRSGDRRDL